MIIFQPASLCTDSHICILEEHHKTENLPKSMNIDLHFKHRHLESLNVTARDYKLNKIVTGSHTILMLNIIGIDCTQSNPNYLISTNVTSSDKIRCF